MKSKLVNFFLPVIESRISWDRLFAPEELSSSALWTALEYRTSRKLNPEIKNDNIYGLQ